MMMYETFFYKQRNVVPYKQILRKRTCRMPVENQNMIDLKHVDLTLLALVIWLTDKVKRSTQTLMNRDGVLSKQYEWTG